MRKLLSLVLAFAMILGLFAFPVSADASTYQQVGRELQALKVLKGVNAAGDLAEMEKLTREQALVVLSRLVGQEEAALATDAQPGFADVPAAHWYSPYVAYAKAQGWTTGVSETEFGLGQSVTTKQALTFMMRALGYTADWSKEDIMMKAKELGLLEGVSATADDAIIRGELFIVMKNTLYTKPMGEKIELIYKLGLAENPVPATLEVVDVKADNLKEVVVEFNQEVDKDTLKDAFKFVGSSHGTLTAKLQEDGKTVVISVENGKELTNKKTYKLQVSKVKTLSGLTVEKVTKEFKADDNTVPTVESVKVVGPSQVVVVFSEPLKPSDGKIKLGLVGKTKSTVSNKTFDGREVTIKTTTLKDGSTYEIELSEFKDYAGYANITTELQFDYAKVSNAPTVEVVTATQEFVEFKFDRPVRNLDMNAFYHTYSSWKPVALYKSQEDMNKFVKAGTFGNQLGTDPVDTVVARFVKKVEKLENSDYPLQVGEVEVNVLGKSTKGKVLDNWSNQLQDTELKVTVTADKTAPVVENVEVTGEKEIEVTFSKKVNAKKENFELLNEDGSKISGLTMSEPKTENATVTLTFTNPKLVGKTVILNIKNVRDNTINQNKMVGTESFTVTFGDKTFEGVEEVVLVAGADTKTFRIKFKEAVDSDAALNSKNYKIAKDAQVKDLRKVDFDVVAFSDKIIDLVFTNENYNKAGLTVPGDYVVISNNVTDALGNKFAGFQQVEPVKTSGNKPEVKSVKAISNTEIEVQFKEEVKIESGWMSGKFTIDGVANSIVGITEELNADGTFLKLEVKENVLPSKTAGKMLKFADAAQIKNLLEVAYDESTHQWSTTGLAIEDKIKPEFAKINDDKSNLATFGITVADLDKVDNNDKEVVAILPDGNTYKVIVGYTEEIEQTSLSVSTYEVQGGWKVDGIPQAQATGAVVIKLKRPDKLTDNMIQNVAVRQKAEVRDTVGNVMSTQDSFVAIQEALKVNLTQADFDATAVQAAKDALKAKVEELNVLLPNADRVAGVTIPGGSADDYGKVVTANINKPFVWDKAYMMPEADVTTFKNAVTDAWNAHNDGNPANQTVDKYNEAKATLEAAKAPYEAAKLVKVDSEEVTINVTTGGAADQTTITGHEATHKYYVLKLTATGERFSTTATPDTAGSYEVTADVTDQDVLKTTLSLSNGDKVLVIKVKDNKVVAQKELEATAVVNGL